MEDVVRMKTDLGLQGKGGIWWEGEIWCEKFGVSIWPPNLPREIQGLPPYFSQPN